MFEFLKKKLRGVTGGATEEEIREKETEKKPPEKKRRTPSERGVKERVVAKLTGKDLEEKIWELEMALLEADVARPVAEEICEEVKNSPEKDLRKGLKDALREILSVPGFDLVKKAKKAEKPFKIMFIGPNGAGKTLTLAKIAFLLKKEELTSVFAASDTFRAASMEQLEEHGKELGIRVVKHDYGADAAAVAYDAVKSAKAKGIDCVLIDTAGRQETNKNLIEELRKINRVIQPDVRIYVDEALAGNVLPRRARAFQEAVGIDGVVLTKMDADVKGGGAISIAHQLEAPILFLGVGQEHQDLKPFRPQEVLENIFG